MIFDSHCHLGLGDESTADTVQRALAKGVSRMLNVGIDAASSRAARTTSRAARSLTSRAARSLTSRAAKSTSSVLPDNSSSPSDPVYYSAGLHPNHAGSLDTEWAEIAAMCRVADCTAIGESGLDYHWDQASPRQQKRSFAAHLELARELDKPVIVHCREAFDDTFEMLAAHPGVRGVIHCFSGGVGEARRALEFDFYLSFAGPLTYRNADDLRAAAVFAPTDRILVETDAPFLPPQEKRGTTNEPAFIVHTLARLAEIRGIGFEAAAATTMANTERLFFA